ncbi:ClpP/crotonase-like domain-containing protein [Schizothecium vesticola]|uniref:ClpP/crotonase-like domain-containing protein n=1 Tax=Schizothecium vesticola TaxID=314040 RepID=A0AA40JZQ2_9PEZI|nr:ClpP/crotonase-like domain-containing protein [Schizothecium vesticola]
MATLFTIPIPPLGAHPGGAVVCTEPAPQVVSYTLPPNPLLPPDNRLTTPTNAALVSALDVLEFGPHPPGVVLTTSAIQKFYSNGLDLENALADPAFLPTSLYHLFLRFLTFPMPTVAVLNGHAFAGGLMLAMHHDYRIMSPARGFLCVNELDFGVPLKAPMSSIFRLKCAPATYRSLVLEAQRFDGKAALEAGIVDGLGGVQEAVAMVGERKLTEKGRTGIYGAMKREMYRESVELLSEEGFAREEAAFLRGMEGEQGRRERGEGRVREILKGGKGAKL